MYQELTDLDVSIKARFVTLEKNIKSKSNSFYDAYLDLVECVTKYIACELDVRIPFNFTCGKILNNGEYRKKYIEGINGNKDVLFLMQDLILECNNHKHKNEKEINSEDIFRYIKCFFDYVNYYLVYKGKEICVFDIDYFTDLYNYEETIENKQKENEERIDKKLNSIDRKLENLQKNNMPSVNDTLENRIIVSKFIANAMIKIFFNCIDKSFTKQHKGLRNLFFAYIACGILTPILATINFKMYSTFTLFESVLFIFQFVICFKALKLKDEAFQDEIDQVTFYRKKIVLDNRAVVDVGDKFFYQVFTYICYISIIANFTAACIINPGALTLVVIVMELLFLTLNYVLSKKITNFMSNYDLYVFKGTSTTGECVQIYYSITLNQYISEEAFDALHKGK